MKWIDPITVEDLFEPVNVFTRYLALSWIMIKNDLTYLKNLVGSNIL